MEGARDVLASPSMAVLVTMIIGIVLAWRRVMIGRWLLGLSIGAFAAIAFTPLSLWMLRPLEQRFPQPHPGKVDGIVVLGGAISLARSLDHDTPELNQMAGRMFTFAALAQRYPEARLAFSGGGRLNVSHGEAWFAQKLFSELGLARVVYEDRSRDTHENAVFSYRLLRPKPGERWLLVTSAADLPRAVGAFRSAGWTVTGYPADHHSIARRGGFFPGVTDGFEAADWAAHEWIGLIYYRWRGWTPTLLPGPQ
jgi:uncharacterized SAM-binding protein YcdF (DUF218 family)